VASLNLGDN